MVSDLIASALLRLVEIPTRLQNVVVAYLLALMLDGPKKTLSRASAVSGLNKSQFSRLLSEHLDLAVTCLTALAIETARKAGIDRNPLVKGTPWSIAIIVDATLHPRSSLRVRNAQRFNHGQGFVIGHQWTNVVIFINGQLVPLPPIPFWTKKECRRRGVAYKTEHERLADYLAELQLAKFVGFYDPKEVAVIADAGYDNKKLQRLILDLGWDFLSALKSSRGVQTSHESKTSPKGWRRISALFRAVKKQAPWTNVRVETDDGKKRRTFRARKLTGRIKGVHRDVALLCSEKSNGKGRRYFACSNTKVSTGAIIRAYRIRWTIELFHRAAKSQLGMTDAGVSDFDAQTAHVHWVYAAWLTLHRIKLANEASLLERQRSLTRMAARAPMIAEFKRIIAARTQCGGVSRQKRLMEEAVQAAMAS